MKDYILEYHEVSLTDVLRYFAKDFKREGGKIINSEWTIDQSKDKVIFKLLIEDDD